MSYLSNPKTNKKEITVLYVFILIFTLFALFVYFQINRIGGVMLMIASVYLIIFTIISNIKFKKNPASVKTFLASNQIIVGILMMVFAFGIIFLRSRGEKSASNIFTIDQILAVPLAIYFIINGRRMLKIYNKKKQEKKL
jgi:hypothetical protein